MSSLLKFTEVSVTKKQLLPQRLTRFLLSENYINSVAQKLDKRGEGEAIIIEFKHP